MRVPLSWLKDYIDTPVSVEELAERLTLAGLEVESTEYIGLPQADLPWDSDKIVVGEVHAVRPHPNADRLVLTEVAYGGGRKPKWSSPARLACWSARARATCISKRLSRWKAPSSTTAAPRGGTR